MALTMSKFSEDGGRLRITVTPSQIEQVERWVKATSTSQGVVCRSRIILLAHRGKSSQAIGKSLQVSQPTSRLWKERFLEGEPRARAQIASGRGRKRSLSRRKAAAVVRAPIHAKPKGQTHWSCRSMACRRLAPSPGSPSLRWLAWLPSTTTAAPAKASATSPEAAPRSAARSPRRPATPFAKTAFSKPFMNACAPPENPAKSP